MLWLSVSVILKKQNCIRYSKRRKFRHKMCQNAFSGRAPPDPLGELQRYPRHPSRNWGQGCLLRKGREGKEWEKGRKGMGTGKGRMGRGWREGRARHVYVPINKKIPLHRCPPDQGLRSPSPHHSEEIAATAMSDRLNFAS